MLPVEGLGEETKALAVPSAQHLVTLALCDRTPSLRQILPAHPARERRPTIDRSPAHCPRERVDVEPRSKLPDARIARRCGERDGARVTAPVVERERETEASHADPVQTDACHGLLDQALEQRSETHRIFVHDSRVGEQRLERQDELAHEIVLTLLRRGVADAHPTVSSESLEVGQELFRKVSPAVDPVQRLQGAALRDVPQEVQELLAFVEVPEAPKSLDHERRIPQPAVPIVPRALGAHRLGQAGRRRGDDGTGVVVGVELQAERGAKDALRGEVRQRASLGPRAPAGHRQRQLLVQARHRGGVLALAVRQDEVEGSRQQKLALRHDVRAGEVGREVKRGGGTEDLQAVGGLTDLRVGARIVGARIEVDAQLRVPRERSNDPHDLERDAYVEPFGKARREVDDLPRAAVDLEMSRQHVRVPEVSQGPAHLALAREKAECPPVHGVQQPSEHGRGVESRKAQPLDRARRRDEREDAPVADGSVV